MTTKNRITIADLPPEYQAQARRQLSSNPRRLPADLDVLQTLPHPKDYPPNIRPRNTNAAPVERETSAISKKSNNLIRIPAKRQPNKTEAAYNAAHLAGFGMYEAITLRLPGGSRYTPDFVTWDSEGRMTCHEVKGSYKLHSHGRAAAAFREAVAAFPFISFVWAVRRKNGVFEVQNCTQEGAKMAPTPPSRFFWEAKSAKRQTRRGGRHLVPYENQQHKTLNG